MFDDKASQSLVDVFTKGLDMAKSGLAQGYELAKQAAPELWQMARRQTIIEGLQDLFFLVLTIIFMIVLCRVVVAINRKAGSCESGYSAEGETWLRGDWSVLSWLLAVFGYAGSTVCIIDFGTEAINYLFNPDYWTLLRLVKLLKGGA